MTPKPRLFDEQALIGIICEKVNKRGDEFIVNSEKLRDFIDSEIRRNVSLKDKQIAELWAVIEKAEKALEIGAKGIRNRVDHSTEEEVTMRKALNEIRKARSEKET